MRLEVENPARRAISSTGRVAVIEPALGALEAQGEGALRRQSVEVIRKQPRQMPRSYSKSQGQRGHTVAVERATLDQAERAFDRRPGAFPGWTEWRCLRPAAKAGTKTSAFGCRCVRRQSDGACTWGVYPS